MITLRSFQALFLRYRALHRSIWILPRKFRAADGSLLARLERIRVSGNMLQLRGWARTERVLISSGGQQIMTVNPSVPRPDIAAHCDARLQSGFEIQIPLSATPCDITFEGGGHRVKRLLPRASWLRLRSEDLRLWLALSWAGLRGIPAIYDYLFGKEPSVKEAAKQQLKQLLGVGIRARRDHLFQLPGFADDAPAPAPDQVTIILPVYNAFELLQECLSRVESGTAITWHLILIEDCSTDERIRPFLRDWASGQGPDRVTLLENDHNLGFVGSVNRGLTEALPRQAPVVLLNSDAFLPEGWAPRLLAPLADTTVASVTPMSNDAEIMNVPVICQRSDLVPGQADLLDRAARDFLSAAPLVDLPTGVGFCMALSPTWLGKSPQFDTAFGRGYGEEVDWCRRIIGLGGRHVAMPGLFVEHRGGESFESESKRALIEAHNRIISQRYPGYDAEVQEFIADDPLIGPRLLLSLVRIASMASDPVPLYLCHALGGGAEDTVMRRIQEDLSEGKASVILRVGGRFRYMVELHMPEGVSYGNIDDEPSLVQLLEALPERHLIYVCGVGDLEAHRLPDRLIEWSASPSARLTIEIHDYFPISPSYTLLNHGGHFSGLPQPSTHGADLAHQFVGSGGQSVSLAEWQEAWGGALQHATSIEVFSQSSRDFLVACWPYLAGPSSRINLRPHPPLHAVPRASHQVQNPPRKIGVLGNIGYQKGIAVLADLSRRLSTANGERLVVIGDVDPTYPLTRKALVHGRYTRAEIAPLAGQYEIDCWLIPSIWPETFSYTTREALATGLPVWCFDLGAQAEALRRAGQEAHILPAPATTEAGAQSVLEQILRRG